MHVEITDHTDEVLAAMRAAALRGLEKCGLVAEGYAKKLCSVDTGNLRNSITHTVTSSGERAAYVGTDSEYAIYVEMGTGQVCDRRQTHPVGLQGRTGQLAHDARTTRTAVY